MTVNEANELLSKITYKPIDMMHGLPITRSGKVKTETVARMLPAWSPVGPGPHNAVIEFAIPSYNIERKEWGCLTRTRMIPIGTMDKRMLLEYVQAQIRDMEIHEVSEFLRFDGKWLTDPHPDNRREGTKFTQELN